MALAHALQQHKAQHWRGSLCLVWNGALNTYGESIQLISLFYETLSLKSHYTWYGEIKLDACHVHFLFESGNGEVSTVKNWPSN